MMMPMMSMMPMMMSMVCMVLLCPSDVLLSLEAEDQLGVLPVLFGIDVDGSLEKFSSNIEGFVDFHV